jgi:hypothetical protein
VGGHAYAGNLLVFDRARGVPRGNWFGYVTPADVPPLLSDFIGTGAPPPPRLWRGAMGMSTDACVAEAKHLFAECGDAGAGCAVRCERLLRTAAHADTLLYALAGVRQGVRALLPGCAAL